MLFWFQISALLILVGAELNAVLEKRRAAAATAVPAPASAPPAVGPAPGGRGEPVVELAVFAGLLLAVMAFFRRRDAD